ncbi:DUF1192 domain-containing protein [Blastochloris viridis]|uniref:Putative small protein containing a coiled-coil domain protein n=1 Tax=Blastochloris viridis TaxID=1079 RepID=A0A0H5BES6_BLAVI|nr:DUF1192 domain-containing protein [Blastochloris viridis]ALK07891.1 hypothetical protein BVIR_74 [Blastochloris viridis]BAR98861.1 hypothetical protein BV133_1268 [Blastochloris viridis]CUU43813.1 putative small protein containing a coiled-coil domain protein [Blastochloris viridis]
MVFRDDDAPRRKVSHDIGQLLDTLSIGELEERIELLRAEIVRLEAAALARKATQAAATDIFKRPS